MVYRTAMNIEDLYDTFEDYAPEPFTERCTTCGKPANIIDGRYHIQLCWQHYRMWQFHLDANYWGWWLYRAKRSPVDRLVNLLGNLPMTRATIEEPYG